MHCGGAVPGPQREVEMTRLEQAFRWWKNNSNADFTNIPHRHYHVLRAAKAIEPVEPAMDGVWVLNAKGHQLKDSLTPQPPPAAGGEG